MLQNDDSFRRSDLLDWGMSGEVPMPQVPVTVYDIEHFRCRAQVCRAEAELTREPGRRQERLETARAYERMAERGKRRLGLTE